MTKANWQKIILCFLCFGFLIIYAWKDLNMLTNCCESQSSSSIVAFEKNTSINRSDISKDLSAKKLAANIALKNLQKDNAQQSVPSTPIFEKLSRANEVKDVDIDGRLSLGHDGEIIYDQNFRDLLDFFIGLTTDVRELSDLTFAFSAYLTNQHFDKETIAQATHALQRYLAYREAAVALDMQIATTDFLDGNHNTYQLAHLFEQLAQLRETHLGMEMAEGFFAEEEASNRYLMARLTERQKFQGNDSNNTDSNNTETLDQIFSGLPIEVAMARQQATQVSLTRKAVSALKNAGATEESIYQVRQQAFGSEAAERLRLLDARRVEWGNKVEQYQQEKNQLMTHTYLTEDQLHLAIDDLQRQYFSETERLRINAL